MSKPVILCIDDQREVLAALTKDLEPFAERFDLIDAESAEDAGAVLDELLARGTPIALIISDHVMPGTHGVDLLASLRGRDELRHTGRLLLTGLATHEDTIRAINQAAIDRYIAKPWKPDELHRNVSELLTNFILANYPDDYQRFLPVLSQDVMLQIMQQGAGPHGDR